MKPILFVCLLAGAASAQELHFERGSSGAPILHVNPGEFVVEGIPLRDVLAVAFGVQGYQVTGPSSLATAVNATYRTSLRDKAAREAFRDALIRKLDLRYRIEESASDGFALRAIDGLPHRMTPSKAGKPHARRDSSGLDAEGLDMNFLAGTLERTLRKPVSNETALAGSFDFELNWREANEESIRTAVSKQLGLQLVPSPRSVTRRAVESLKLPD